MPRSSSTKYGSIVSSLGDLLQERYYASTTVVTNYVKPQLTHPGTISEQETIPLIVLIVIFSTQI